MSRRLRAAAVLVGATIGVLAPTIAVAASGSINVTDSSGTSVGGQTVTAPTTLQVSAAEPYEPFEAKHHYKLVVASSSGAVRTLDRVSEANVPPNQQFAGTVDLTGTFDTADSPYLGIAPNDTYVFSDDDGTQEGVTLAIPPATVADFSASYARDAVSFAWHAGSEPDLTHYVITGSDGSRRIVTPVAAGCDGSEACTTTGAIGSGDAGSTVTYTIEASRCRAPDECSNADDIDSPASTAAKVAVPATKKTKPRPSTSASAPGSGQSAGPSPTSSPTTSSGNHGGGVGQNGFTKHHHLQAFVPHQHTKRKPGKPGKTGRSKAHPSSSQLPGGEGQGASSQPQGSYQAKLPYGRHSTSGPKVQAGTFHSITNSIQSALNQSALLRSLALGAILVLLGAHLLAWLRRSPADY